MAASPADTDGEAASSDSVDVEKKRGGALGRPSNLVLPPRKDVFQGATEKVRLMRETFPCLSATATVKRPRSSRVGGRDSFSSQTPCVFSVKRDARSGRCGAPPTASFPPERTYVSG